MKVLAAVRVMTPSPDLTRRTVLPAPLLAMTELMTNSLLPTVQVWAVWVETAGREIVTCVALSTETTNAPTGIPVPEMVMPGPMPTVEFIVTAVELTVVAPAKGEPAVRVWLLADAVAAVLKVTCVSESTDRTVVPAMKLPLVTVMPGRRPKALMPTTMADPEVMFVKLPLPVLFPKSGLPLA